MDETKVLNFMDEVQKIKDKQVSEEEYRNSRENKLNIIEQEREPAKMQCINHVFANVYKKALPLNDEYKQCCSDNLDDEMATFITDRCDGDEGKYMTDCAKRSAVCKKLLEKVTDVVNDYFEEKADNIDSYSADEMAFRMDDATERKLDLITKELELDDVSDVIADNVKATAIAEITRAKEQKEANKKLEQELANDMAVKTEAAIEDILSFRGLMDTKDYNPTLFQGIMIGNLNTTSKMYESGHLDDYYVREAVSEYGANDSAEIRQATVPEVAFLESVKELTRLSIVKALNMEDLIDVNKVNALAREYAEKDF